MAQTRKLSALAVNNLSRCCVTMHLHVACSPQRRNPVNSSKPVPGSCCDDVGNEDNETAMPIRCAMIERRSNPVSFTRQPCQTLISIHRQIFLICSSFLANEIQKKTCERKVQRTIRRTAIAIAIAIAEEWRKPYPSTGRVRDRYVNAKRKIITRNEVNKARKASPICIIVTLLLR